MLDAEDTSGTTLQMMQLFELTNTDLAHAVVFRDAD